MRALHLTDMVDICMLLMPGCGVQDRRIMPDNDGCVCLHCSEPDYSIIVQRKSEGDHNPMKMSRMIR